MGKELNNKLNALLISVFVAVIFYVAGCVSGADYNPFLWPESVRKCVSSCWVCFEFIAVIITINAIGRNEQ